MPDLHCPRCQQTLEARAMDEVDSHFTTHSCPACGGSWFAAGDLRHIEDVVVPRLLEIRHLPPEEEQLKVLRCPACSAETGAKVTLSKIRHYRDRHVTIDVCPRCHGTWLDAGELEAIQQEGLFTFLVNTVRWLARVV